MRRWTANPAPTPVVSTESPGRGRCRWQSPWCGWRQWQRPTDVGLMFAPRPLVPVEVPEGPRQPEPWPAGGLAEAHVSECLPQVLLEPGIHCRSKSGSAASGQSSNYNKRERWAIQPQPRREATLLCSSSSGPPGHVVHGVGNLYNFHMCVICGARQFNDNLMKRNVKLRTGCLAERFKPCLTGVIQGPGSCP